MFTGRSRSEQLSQKFRKVILYWWRLQQHWHSFSTNLSFLCSGGPSLYPWCGGWRRVRHVPQGNSWHPARDNLMWVLAPDTEPDSRHLRGTERYGDSEDDSQPWSSPGRNSLGRMEIRDTRTVPSLSRPAQTVISPTKVIIFPLPPGLDCSDCSKDVPQESSPLGSNGQCQRLWRICESIGVFRGFYDLWQWDSKDCRGRDGCLHKEKII